MTLPFDPSLSPMLARLARVLPRDGFLYEPKWDGFRALASRALRPGKVFVDWSQNDRMKSTVAPYSLRATALPLVSTPITWDEIDAALARKDPSALVAAPDEALRRLARVGDLFAPVLDPGAPRLSASQISALAS